MTTRTPEFAKPGDRLAGLRVIGGDQADPLGLERQRFQRGQQRLWSDAVQRDDPAGFDQRQGGCKFGDAVGDIVHEGVVAEGDHEFQMGGPRGQDYHAL